MKYTRNVALSLILISFILLQAAQFTSVSYCAPTTVGTTTDTSAVSPPLKRKSFFVKGRVWVFYGSGSDIIFKTSADNGASWSSATTVATGTVGEQFDIYFDGTYLSYARYTPYAIKYRRGIPNENGTITWSAPEQTVYSGSSSLYHTDPCITVDSNGYAWIGTRRHDVNNAWYFPFVFKNSLNNGSWQTASGFPVSLSSTSDTTWKVRPIALTAGKVYVIYIGSNTGYLYGKLWTGSSFGSQEQIFSSAIINTNYFSAVAAGDDVHVAQARSDRVIEYRKRTYGSGWGSVETIDSSTSIDKAPALCYNSLTESIYLFYFQNTDNTLYYRIRSSSGWGAKTSWFSDSEGVVVTRFTVFENVYSGRLGVLYVSKTSSPYNVKFERMLFNLPPSIGEFEAPSTAIAGKYFLFNATVTDRNSASEIVNATVQFSGNVVLKWIATSNVFSIHSDPNGYCTLDPSGCFKTALNYSSYKLTWKIKFSSSYPEGYVSIISTNTKVFDSSGASGTGEHSDLFNFVLGADITVTATTIVYPAPWNFYVNATVEYSSGISIVNVTATFADGCILLYDSSSDAFSIYDDPSGYYSLNNSRCQRVSLSPNVIEFVWCIAVSPSRPSGSVTVVGKVYTSNGRDFSSPDTSFTIYQPRIKVLSMYASKDSVRVGEQTYIRAILMFEYINEQVSTGTFYIEGRVASHLGSGLWQIPFVSEVAGDYVFDEITGVSKGVSEVDMNGQSVQIHVYLYYYNLTLYPIYSEETGRLLGTARYTIVFEYNETREYNVTKTSYPLNLEFTDALIQYVAVNGSRQIWLPYGGNIVIKPLWHPRQEIFELEVVDYPGLLATYKYVEIAKLINGTYMPVERCPPDANRLIYFYGVLDERYLLRLMNPETGDYYVYGDIIFGLSAITIQIRPTRFEPQMSLLFSDVVVNIFRDGSVITVAYNDTLMMTVSATVNVYNATMHLLASETYYANCFTYNFVGNANETYIVRLNGRHLKYGTSSIRVNKILPPTAVTPRYTLSLAWMGNLGNINMNYILPAFLVIFISSAVTVLSAPIGAFLAAAITLAFTSMGWLPTPSNLIVAAFAFAIIYAIMWYKRRVYV